MVIEQRFLMLFKQRIYFNWLNLVYVLFKQFQISIHLTIALIHG